MNFSFLKRPTTEIAVTVAVNDVAPDRSLRSTIWRKKLREYLQYDSWLVRKAFALAGLASGIGLWLSGKRLRAFHLLSVVHRGNYDRVSDAAIEAILSRALRPTVRPGGTLSAEYITHLAPAASTARFFENPARLLGTRILVVKASAPSEKGIVIVDYSFVFPLLAKRFRLDDILKRYYLVLEPSTSGYCDPEVLCYANMGEPIFVQSPEPRDTATLRALAPALVPVPITANWWTDPRVMRPLPGASRDVDVIMVSGWAWGKRHYRVFETLARLARAGRHLRVVLVGYPTELKKDDIYRVAQHYGVAQQIEMYEWLSAAEVNEQFNRAKVNVLWSRREGCNRSIIEGMLADVPCVLWRGFNYGHQYDHINLRTGSFADDGDLGRVLLDTIDNPARYSPREWVLDHMSCHQATSILSEAVAKVALSRAEPWTHGPVAKVGHLNAMSYWDDSDRARFRADYEFLESTVRPL